MRTSLPVDSSACVIAVEPNPNMQARLHRNFTLNNFNDVVVIERGASSHTQSSELNLSYQDNEDGYHNPGLATSFNDINSKLSINIELCKIDYIIDEQGLKWRDVKLMKMDIEGAEFDALQGMKKILSEGEPAIILEYNVSNYDKCNDFLESFGYSFFGTLIKYGIDSNLRSENVLFMKKTKNIMAVVKV
jgi:FkbM family methyltransferase